MTQRITFQTSETAVLRRPSAKSTNRARAGPWPPSAEPPSASSWSPGAWLRRSPTADPWWTSRPRQTASLSRTEPTRRPTSPPAALCTSARRGPRSSTSRLPPRRRRRRPQKLRLLLLLRRRLGKSLSR